MKPALAIDQPDGSRAYLHPLTGETVPSVTTVLKCISKPSLDGWAARTTARYACANWDELSDMDPIDRLEILKVAYDEGSRKKRDRGTLVHEICESWAKGTPIAVDKSVDGYMSQFFSFLGERNPEYVEAEVTVWSHQYGYAGTLDAIAVIDGETTIIDIKTGRGLYPEYAMQLGALSHAECIVDENGDEYEIPRITRHALLHLRPRSWKLVPVYEVEASFAAFLAARKIFHWNEEVSPDVFQGES